MTNWVVPIDQKEVGGHEWGRGSLSYTDPGESGQTEGEALKGQQRKAGEPKERAKQEGVLSNSTRCVQLSTVK